MRISRQQQEDVIELVQQHISQSAKIWLFGSRADDNARGGDIDLYIEVENLPDTFGRKINLRLALEDRWGEVKVDLLVHDIQYPEQAIHKIARQEGVRLI